MTRSTIVLLAMILVGGHAAYTSYRFRMGSYKSPYFGRQSLRMYADLGMSVGSFFVILAVITLLTRDSTQSEATMNLVTMVIYAGLGLTAVNWVLAVFQVKWSRPFWVNWLESEYSRQEVDRLRYAAQAMGLKVWEREVGSQAALEEWITAVLSTSLEEAPMEPPLEEE